MRLNITIPDFSEGYSSFVKHANNYTNGLAFNSVLMLIFFGISVVLSLRNSKIALPAAGLVTMFIAFIAMSLGWIEGATLTLWVTVFVVTFIFTLMKK